MGSGRRSHTHCGTGRDSEGQSNRFVVGMPCAVYSRGAPYRDSVRSRARALGNTKLVRGAGKSGWPTISPRTDIEVKNEILTKGLEVGSSCQLPGAVFVRGDVADHLSLRASYTLARYTFVDDSTYQGNDIPGAPRQGLATEIKYTHPTGFSLAPSIEWIPLRAELATSFGMNLFAAGQNLTKRRFSQSVHADNSAGKWFELRWTY
jgi:hypothetical protein